MNKACHLYRPTKFIPAQIKPQSFESRRRNSFFTRGGCASCLRASLGVRLLPQSYQYPNLSEGADRVGGQLRGDKECPFSGVTKYGRVWRKVPESDARRVKRDYIWRRRASATCCTAVWKTVAEGGVCGVTTWGLYISTVCEVSLPEDYNLQCVKCHHLKTIIYSVWSVTTWGLCVWRSATTEICVYHLGSTSQCRHAWRRRHDHHALLLNIWLSLMTVGYHSVTGISQALSHWRFKNSRNHAWCKCGRVNEWVKAGQVSYPLWVVCTHKWWWWW